jgi:hypothetical protein
MKLIPSPQTDLQSVCGLGWYRLGPSARTQRINVSNLCPAATALLLCESGPPKGLDAPETIRILPVWQWLLTEPPGETHTQGPKK